MKLGSCVYSVTGEGGGISLLPDRDITASQLVSTSECTSRYTQYSTYLSLSLFSLLPYRLSPSLDPLPLPLPRSSLPLLLPLARQQSGRSRPASSSSQRGAATLLMPCLLCHEERLSECCSAPGQTVAQVPPLAYIHRLTWFQILYTDDVGQILLVLVAMDTSRQLLVE